MIDISRMSQPLVYKINISHLNLKFYYQLATLIKTFNGHNPLFFISVLTHVTNVLPWEPLFMLLSKVTYSLQLNI